MCRCLARQIQDFSINVHIHTSWHPASAGTMSPQGLKGFKAPWGFAEVLPYNLVGPMTRRPPFPSRGCGLTEVLGFAGSGGCSGVGLSFWGQREALLRREGSPAVLAPSVPGVGGMMTPLAHHRSAGCHRWLRLAVFAF